MKKVFSVFIFLAATMIAHSQMISDGFPCYNKELQMEVRITFDASNIEAFSRDFDQFTAVNGLLVIYSREETKNPSFFSMIKKQGYTGYIVYDIPVNTKVRELSVYWPITPIEYADQVFYELSVKDRDLEKTIPAVASVDEK